MQLNLIEILKVILLGIVEGVTEWLPISSTGHMLLVDNFIPLNMSAEFKELFLYVVQLGAILAVVLLFWKKMWPFQMKDKSKPFIRMRTIHTWLKVVVACIPGAVVTILFDDFIEEHLHTPLVIALMLILYGVAFILLSKNRRKPSIRRLSDISYKTALLIGLFQVLSIIPGTSRSGATIIGALLLGVSRKVAVEFTFILAIPVMFGASLLKIVKYGAVVTAPEFVLLGVGMLVAYIVSMLVIRALINYVKTHDFKVFGWYRIALGALVAAYFLLSGRL